MMQTFHHETHQPASMGVVEEFGYRDDISTSTTDYDGTSYYSDSEA